MKGRRRDDAGLSLVEILVVLTIMGTVGVVFMGVGAVSFGKQAETGNTLIDSAQRIALQSRLQADLRDATATGTSGFPCAPATGTPVLWTQASLPDAVQGTRPGDVIVYYTATMTSKAKKTEYTSFRRTQCTRGEQGYNPAAPEGDEMARWIGTTARIIVRCNARTPGDGCGGGGQLTQELLASTNALAAFPGAPTTGATAAGEYTDPTADRVRIGEETAVFIGGFGTEQLTLSRPNATTWPAGTAISYAPSLFEVCVPLKGVACDEAKPADTLRITVNRRLS